MSVWTAKRPTLRSTMKLFRRRSDPSPSTKARFLPSTGWVQPWWLYRWKEQNKTAAADTPRTNNVARSWTLLGNLESSQRIALDRRGLIAAHPGSWSLDWWMRVDDEWIFPSEHGAVRQRLIDGAPVVETVLRAAGGDLVHRAYAARSDSEYLIVEVENQATRPVALAWAIRPYDHLGGGRIENIELNERALYVNGRVGLVCGRSPGQMVVGRSGSDPARLLDSAGDDSKSVTCEQGMASAALIMPLVHGATVRCVIPLGLSQGADLTSKLPAAAQVARGWGQHAVSASRFVLPTGQLNDVFDASRQSLLLAVAGEEIVPAPGGPPHDASDEAAVLQGLAECGYEGAVRDVLISRARRQDRMGGVNASGLDVTSATLIGAGRALELVPDESLSLALSEFAADGARWILANPDPNAREGLLAAHQILKTVGAEKASRELQELIPSGAQHAEEKSSDGETINVLEMAQSTYGQFSIDPQIALTRLDRLASLASSTMNWPTELDPLTKSGIAGAGNDLRVNAWFVRSFIRLLMDDTGDELRFALAWPREWLGIGVEVHGLPSRYGPVSWAVRWHGNRPALLWEVENGHKELKVRAPGLDQEFVGQGPVGEQLLSAIDDQLGLQDPVVPAVDTPSSGSFS